MVALYRHLRAVLKKKDKLKVDLGYPGTLDLLDANRLQLEPPPLATNTHSLVAASDDESSNHEPWE